MPITIEINSDEYKLCCKANSWKSTQKKGAYGKGYSDYAAFIGAMAQLAVAKHLKSTTNLEPRKSLKENEFDIVWNNKSIEVKGTAFKFPNRWFIVAKDSYGRVYKDALSSDIYVGCEVSYDTEKETGKVIIYGWCPNEDISRKLHPSVKQKETLNYHLERTKLRSMEKLKCGQIENVES